MDFEQDGHERKPQDGQDESREKTKQRQGDKGNF
jgi:hypothetical protein